MSQETSNHDIVQRIDDLARITAEGFAHTASKQELAEVKSDVEGLKSDVQGLKSDVTNMKTGVSELTTRFDKFDRKLDRVLVDEIDRHERWIKLLADKAGVELVR